MVQLLWKVITRRPTREYSVSNSLTSNLKTPFSLYSKHDFEETIKGNTLYPFLNRLIKTQKLKFVPDHLVNPVKKSKLIVDKQDAEYEYDPWLNSPQTLPLTYRLKDKENISTIPRWRKWPTLGFRVGKKLLFLYRESIKTTWISWRQHKVVDVNKIYRQLELNNLNQSFPQLSRKKFVHDMIRFKEIYKLPKFIICLFLFEELTFLFIYLRPQLAFYRCLGNGAFNKVSKKYSKDDQILKQLWRQPVPNENHQREKYNTVYSLSNKNKVRFLQNLIINKQPSWKLKVWEYFNQTDKLSNEVNKLLKYLIVDDWLTLKRIIEQLSSQQSESINISYNELVNYIIERQLYYPNEDLNLMVNDSTDRQVLINRLLCYWSFRFDGIDIKNGTMNFTDKWGVNNINLFNYTGTVDKKGDLQFSLIKREHLDYFLK